MAKKTKKAASRMGRPSLGYECPLLSYGKVHRGVDGWRIVMADEPARVRVTQEHIDHAIAGSANDCVFALAFRDAFGPKYDIYINATVTKVVDNDDKVELRFYTPAGIRTALANFDRLEYWNLPAGIYRFGPMAKGHRNGAHARKSREAASRARKGAKTVVNNQTSKKKGSINRRVPSKKSTATRIITRVATIRWKRKAK